MCSWNNNNKNDICLVYKRTSFITIHLIGAAIFFEFKHYKPKKKFTSTKCFAFMEMDEIKPGPIVIELWVIVCNICANKHDSQTFLWSLTCDHDLRYKKPTDFKRKKLNLLTKKPLYLHLHQTLHKDWTTPGPKLSINLIIRSKIKHFSHLSDWVGVLIKVLHYQNMTRWLDFGAEVSSVGFTTSSSHETFPN